MKGIFKETDMNLHEGIWEINVLLAILGWLLIEKKKMVDFILEFKEQVCQGKEN